MSVALAACTKGRFSANFANAGVGDGGVAVPADAAVDASPGSRWACTSALLAFPDGGAMTWQPNGGLQPDAPQSATWTATDPFPADCTGLVPADVPAARSWAGPDASAFQPICDYPEFDRQGISVITRSPRTGFSASFVRRMEFQAELSLLARAKAKMHSPGTPPGSSLELIPLRQALRSAITYNPSTAGGDLLPPRQ